MAEIKKSSPCGLRFMGKNSMAEGGPGASAPGKPTAML